jgi:hypothetical protein
VPVEDDDVLLCVLVFVLVQFQEVQRQPCDNKFVSGNVTLPQDVLFDEVAAKVYPVSDVGIKQSVTVVSWKSNHF